MVEFFTENLEAIIAWVVGTGILSIVYLLFKKAVLTYLRDIFIVIISNVFGVKKEGVPEIIEQSPVLSKLDKYLTDVQTSNELQLLELARKLNSPAYIESEKANLKAQFDYLFNQISDNLSQEFLNLLDGIMNNAD